MWGAEYKNNVRDVGFKKWLDNMDRAADRRGFRRARPFTKSELQTLRRWYRSGMSAAKAFREW